MRTHLGNVHLTRWDLWQPGLGVVDVTNPASLQWYEEKLDALVDLGVDTFKVRVLGCSSRLLLFYFAYWRAHRAWPGTGLDRLWR